jgi:2-polyprenyl-3-methyl-5-hydroxy-6-metoxy-1,4-benzoquinol methylase
MVRAQHPPWSCPRHGTELIEREGALHCPQGCRHPVEAGIPRFVPPGHYAEAFGLQWKTYRRTQLDSQTGATISRDRLRRCLGEELWAGLAGRRVLEAGCGAGRFTEILLARGACVTSVDLSDAVEANQENFPQGPMHRVAQADILALPFAPHQFDVVLCLGVVQHTPEPERTLAALREHVRPGGWLVVDHYRYNLSYYTKTAPLFRAVMRRLPPDRGLRWSKRLVDALLPVHRAVKRSRPGQMLVSRVSPVLCYYHVYPDLDDRQQRELALLDTHDSLTDRFKHFRTRDQLRRSLEGLGLADVWCENGGNGVEARGRLPA